MRYLCMGLVVSSLSTTIMVDLPSGGVLAAKSRENHDPISTIDLVHPSCILIGDPIDPL